MFFWRYTTSSTGQFIHQEQFVWKFRTQNSRTYKFSVGILAQKLHWATYPILAHFPPRFSNSHLNERIVLTVFMVDEVFLMDELSSGWNGIPPFFNCIFIVRFSERKQKTNFNNFTYTKNNMHVEKCWAQYFIVSHNNQNKQYHKIKDNR